MPAAIACFVAASSFDASNVLPAPTPIRAKRAISPCSDATVGQNCSRKLRTWNNSSEAFCAASVSGVTKASAGAAFGAGWPRNAESGCAL